MILADTNVLVYALNLDAAQHEASRTIMEAGFRGDLPLVLVPQVLVEAYAILTDANRVTHPLSPDQAWLQIEAYRAGLTVFDFGAGALVSLGELVRDRRPTAQDIFDAALVAQMRAHGVTTLCTYNTADFTAYAGISAEAPEALLKRYRLGRTRRRER